MAVAGAGARVMGTHLARSSSTERSFTNDVSDSISASAFPLNVSAGSSANVASSAVSASRRSSVKSLTWSAALVAAASSCMQKRCAHRAAHTPCPRAKPAGVGTTHDDAAMKSEESRSVCNMLLRVEVEWWCACVSGEARSQ